MKRLAATMMILLLGAAGAATAADTWSIDPAHSEVTFKIRHLMSSVTGRFGTFNGTIVTDFDNLKNSSVMFTIDAATIDTNNADRDKHLRSPDFFDVEKYSEITFASSKIAKTGDNTFNVTGTFTMHGVAKEITIPVTLLGVAQDPWGNTKAGFEVEGTIDRKEYGIVWNKALDAGGVLLGDEVQIFINLQAGKQ
jgi:polyisoprenoid-binding protein YceI